MARLSRFRSSIMHLTGTLGLTFACSSSVPERAPGGVANGMPPGAGTASNGLGGSGSTTPGAVGGQANPNPSATGGAAQASCRVGAPLAPARIWMLTDAEYVNVVRDVLGVMLAGPDADITTSVSKSGNFTNFSEAFKVDAPAAQGYQRAANKVASLAKPCGANVTATCVESFIRDQVARAWRRPVTDTESAELLKLYNDYAPSDGPDSAFQLVLQAVLQAPSFVYRSEIGVDASTATAPVSLTSFELASALGFLFNDSVPDAALWSKAVDNTLSDPAVFASEVERLLGLPGTRAQLGKLVGYWAGLELIPGRRKDATLFPEYSDTLKTSLYEGARSFLSDVLWSGKFSDLFTSRKVYLNQELASVYGFPGVTGAALVPSELPPAYPAAGIFTQPGILAANNKRSSMGDPIHRGLYIYDTFVCGGTLPAPPAGALDAAKAMMGTERELATQRANNGTCRGCHALFDPLGLTLDQFDPIGRFKPSDSKGAPVASDSVLAGLGPDLDGPVAGIAELAARLSMGRRSSDCAASTVSKFSLGYTSQTESCDLTQARDQFAASGSFPAFFRAILTAPGFRLRSPELE